LNARILPASEDHIELAARGLHAGKLVAFPTETVYGLGADAGSREAVAAIYRVKGRPSYHPLIVHVSGPEQARRLAQWTETAQRLAAEFWPGPLTLILNRLERAPAWACAGQATIGLRAPAHPVAIALLQAFERLGGLGVAGPSANRFGRVSPTCAAHVVDDLADETPLVLDGGDCEVGLESTIVDLSRGEPALLRPGGIDAANIEAVLGQPLRRGGKGAPRVSGTLAAHYAPRTPVELLAPGAIGARLKELAGRGLQVAVWSTVRPGESAGQWSGHWERAPSDPAGFAHALYASLRRLDRGGFDRLLIERPPETGEWAAVADRLRRAAVGAAAPD
jgi:L-threonylcarbamoyladenylate synthase